MTEGHRVESFIYLITKCDLSKFALPINDFKYVFLEHVRVFITALKISHVLQHFKIKYLKINTKHENKIICMFGVIYFTDVYSYRSFEDLFIYFIHCKCTV